MVKLTEIESIIEENIASLDFTGEPKELYEPIEYFFALGGKRVRPKLVLLTYLLYSKVVDSSIISPALAIEIFHAFTLIHDDIMDRAPLRRNRESVHEKWNDNIALLSGDVISILSYKYVAEAPKEKLSEVLKLFTETAIKVCEGQQFDMNYEALSVVSMDDYFKMIGLKTAVLLAASAKMGALIAGAPLHLQEALYNFGYQLGIAFQIKDDYLDIYSTTSSFGKKVGSDIISGKKSWLLVEAIRVSEGDLKERLLSTIECSKISDTEKVASVLSIYNQLGIREAAEKQMNRYHNLALKSLEESGFPSTQLDLLHSYALELLNRDK